MLFYRYENSWGIKENCDPESFCMADMEVDLEEYVFKSIKKTPKGYWIIPKCIKEDTPYADKHKKWVSMSTAKRFAYPTKQEALYGLERRKRTQLSILENQIKLTKATIQKLWEMKDGKHS